MTNNKIFYCLVAGVTAGIFVSSFFKLGFSFFIFLLAVSLVLFIFAKFGAKIENKNGIIFLAIFIFSLGLGILRYEVKDVKIDQTYLENQINQKVVLQGVIIQEPSIKEQTVELIVEVKDSGKVLISAGLFPEFRYGDIVEVNGILKRPENFETENGKDFDYISYLAREDIFYQISFAQVKFISNGHGSKITGGLLFVKNSFVNKINLLIKEPEAALLNGLLLGAKNSLGKDLQADFRSAGVSHIVALSGYNITIVAEAVMAMLLFLPRAWSLSFGALGILLFAIMTGGSATVVRASIMALLVLVAKATGRTYDVTRALFLALLFMLAANPKILVFDISFQLSFLSTVALIWISPLIENRCQFVTEKFKLRELIVATLATQIFVLPFIFYKMGMISLVALPVNLLILPVVPLIMLLGFLTAVFGFISTLLALPLAFATSLLLSYVLKVITISAALPFAALTLKNFPLFVVIIVYIFYGVIIWRSRSLLRRPTSLD